MKNEVNQIFADIQNGKSIDQLSKTELGFITETIEAQMAVHCVFVKKQIPAGSLTSGLKKRFSSTFAFKKCV